MPSASVVKEAKCVTEILDAFDSLGREVAVGGLQAILESFEPPLDVVVLPA